MRHPVLKLAVFAIVLFAFGCSGEQRLMTKPAPVVVGGDDRQSDAFQLGSAAIEEDLLVAEVSYSGGCRKHEFVLLASRTFEVMSGSVQLEVTLIHDANDDSCEAYLTEHLGFDLRPISRRYRETYNRDSGTVYLRLDGHSGPLVYRF